VCRRCTPSVALYSVNSLMVNSPPRLLRSALNFRLYSPSARTSISLVAATARSLEGTAATHMYWLRSSTSSKKYSLPLGVTGAIGPHKSPCTSSRHHLAWYSAFVRNEVGHCFPPWHASHNYSTWPIFGKPCTCSSRSSF
jgi:hypothetical protein